MKSISHFILLIFLFTIGIALCRTNESIEKTYWQPIAISNISEPMLIKSDFLHTEGPVWDREKCVFYFSDINASKIFRLTLPDSIEVFIEPSNNSNGLAFDIDGNIITAEHKTRRISKIRKTGKAESLIDNYRGKIFNSPNDMAVRSDGTIYFTDPEFGLGKQKSEMGFMGLFRLIPSGELFLENKYVDSPNGLSLSPDEKKLYLSHTFGNKITVFDIEQDGSLLNERFFAEVKHPDGMAVDLAGNIYIAGLEGLHILKSDGTLIGILQTDSQPTNCCFGDSDGKTLLITARDNIYFSRVPVPGSNSYD